MQNPREQQAASQQKRPAVSKQLQQKLDEKEEVVVPNLDKSLLVFSKKHVILVHRNLADFYSIRLRKPFQGDQERTQITVQIVVSDPNSIQVDPAQVTLDNRMMSASIRVTSVGLSQITDADKQFELRHVTSSTALDYHKLAMSIQCYSLNMQFKEVLAAGKDDQYQLGVGSRATEFSERKYHQGKELNLLQRNQRPPSEMQAGPETHSLTVPEEINLTFGLSKNQKKNLALEMAQIAAGQQHTMIVKKDGSVYSWGLGLSGQLGFTYDEIKDNDLAVAQQSNLLQDEIRYQRRIDFCPPTYSRVAKEAENLNHDFAQQAALATNESRVKKNGQTFDSAEADGIYLYDTRFQIPFVPSPKKLDLPFRVRQIACGAHHSLVLSEQGQIFGCGLANEGQLGVVEETLRDREPPCNILYPTMTQVPLQSASGIIQLMCGDNFSLALSAGGDVYSCGSGQFGIHGCGADETNNRYQFAPIGTDDGSGTGFFKQRQIRYISAGENHCGAIDLNGVAFTWGLNARGQCGVQKGGRTQVNGSSMIVSPPQPVVLQSLVEKQGANFTGQQNPMEAKRVKALMIECGGSHTLFLSQDNDVYACGSNDKGQLGIASGDFESQNLPRRIEVLAEKTVTTIKAGSRHSMCLTVEGYCFAWGSNDRGQLGINDAGMQRKDACLTVPTIVDGMLGRGLSSLHCRYSQTFWGNSEPGFYISIDGEIFKMWKQKLKRFEDKNIQKANNTYRNIKRIEKSMASEKNNAPGDQRTVTDRKSSPILTSQKYHGAQATNAVQKTTHVQSASAVTESQPQVLGPKPTFENSKPATYLLGYQQKLDKLDAKKGQKFEQEDFRSENCVVSGFKKVSYTKKQQAHTRTTSYVSSFPFNGHSHVLEDGSEVMPKIEDSLPNQEALISSIEQAAAAEQDQEMAENPFVYLMMQAKMRSFTEEASPGEQEGDSQLRFPTNFSMFNKHTEYPYETTANVFKISPPEQSDSD